MNMIEIYGVDGDAKQLINGDKIVCVSPIKLNSKDCVQIEHSSGIYVFNSYETLENFQKRTGEKWIEVKNPNGETCKIKKSAIVAYWEKNVANGIYTGPHVEIALSSALDGVLGSKESLESFEAKLGIKREEQK